MKTIVLCFVASFVGAFAIPLENDRIVGGGRTTIEEHPYMVSVRSWNRHACGGSIVTETSALTTASCLDYYPEYFSISCGSALRLGDFNSHVRSIYRLLRHPRFVETDKQSGFNAGLVFWKKPLTFGSTIRPIQLPQQNAQVPYGKLATVTGWGGPRPGKPSIYLEFVSTPLMTTEECNRHHNNQISQSMLCAGLPQGGRGTCGDGGGPLVIEGVQLGISSWGNGCGVANSPDVYTRVPYVAGWIRENMHSQ